MSPVLAKERKLMKRLSSRKASMTRMVRPICPLLKLTAFMAPAEVPQTLWKSVRPRSMRTSRTPAVNMPRKPPPSRTSAGAVGCGFWELVSGMRPSWVSWVLLRGYTHHATGGEQKAAGRARRPAAERTWWRCGESNSGPKQVPDRCLQAQLPVRSQLPRTR